MALAISETDMQVACATQINEGRRMKGSKAAQRHTRQTDTPFCIIEYELMLPSEEQLVIDWIELANVVWRYDLISSIQTICRLNLP